MLSNITPLAAGGNPIDLSGSWNDFWGALQDGASIGPILHLMAIVGVLIVVLALIKWAWDRRRGLNGGNSGAIWGALLVGALLSAPDIIIPVVLSILDLVANAVWKVFNSNAK